MNRNEGVYVNVGNGQHVDLQQQAVAPPAANSSAKSPTKKYKNVLFGMGIVEIIIGSISTILGIITLIIATTNPGYYDNYYDDYDKKYYDTFHTYFHGMTYSVQGIWSGLFTIVVGILGVRARSNPSRCMYNANMALSIIGALVMGAAASLSGIAAGITNYRLPSLVAVHAMLALLGVAAVIIMIIHSAYCCAGICCKPNQIAAAVSHHPSPPGMQQPQLIQLVNGQYVLAHGQTISTHHPVPQIPVVGGHMTYHQPPQVGVPGGIPTTQLYPYVGLQQAPIASRYTPVVPDAPQNVGPSMQHCAAANS